MWFDFFSIDIVVTIMEQEVACQTLPLFFDTRDGNQQTTYTRRRGFGERLPLIPGAKDGNQQKTKTRLGASGEGLPPIPGPRITFSYPIQERQQDKGQILPSFIRR